MAEYYVIRDKNTGLYFRGKGANRWGKHYNQATIYRVKGTAEHSLKDVAWHGEQAEIVPIQIIENPTDITEVVRCKECKHYKPQSKSAHWNCTTPYCCRCTTVKVSPDDFCSYGERRSND